MISTEIKKQVSTALPLLYSTTPVQTSTNRTSITNDTSTSKYPPASVNTFDTLWPYSKDSPVVDILPPTKRCQGDVCYCLFGETLDNAVDHILEFATKTTSNNELLNIQAFVHTNTIFVMLPRPSQSTTNNDILTWSSKDFQLCFTRLINLLEDETGCQYLAVAIHKHQNHDTETLIRAFRYIGFQLVNPSVYKHSSDYLLVGYEL